MSEWNCSNPEERIAWWKELRDRLNGQEEAEMLNSIAHFFASVPVGTRYIDYYTPASWPTPWEILYDKLFCANTVSLLIYYTLILQLGEERVDILLVEDDTDRFLLPIVDKKYLLNYVLGEISNVEDFPQIKVIETFRNEELPALA